MKIVLRRKNRKLRKLKFTCTRCGAIFLADLYPDCEFKYDLFLHGVDKVSLKQGFSDNFHSISTICPDCGEVVKYGKQITIRQADGIVIT